MGTEDGRAEEIVIIRRRGGAEDDHHHGGVWKIAYADFMTAMMAFFLVMWLINASNTETKSSIASYFNPVKLTDNVSRTKGLHDIDEKANATQKAKKKSEEGGSHQKRDAATSQNSSASATEHEKAKDDKLSPHERESQPAASASNGVGASGEAFRDPFNPLASARQLLQQHLPDTPAPEAAPSANNPKVDDQPSGSFNSHATETAQRIRKDVEEAIKRLGFVNGPGLEVATEGDAIVLSLTDTSTFGMFAIGSAKPSDDLVKLVGSITPIVNDNNGRLTIRGHTDSRPFPGISGNNNWRLSMARAEAVYTMLIQSHVDDSRFERIEAYADRKAKDPSNPEAAVNRRIDILLRPVHP
ncbi:MAG: flagellar motor protein MotB [Hyphomicrobiaceae bacterium]